MQNGDKWYVKNVAGKVFGPIDLETLKKWVRDGRVEPLAGVSGDLQNWTIAPSVPELEMNWIVENNPGQFYGPTHRDVVDDLKKSGALTPAARFYCDDRGDADDAPKWVQAQDRLTKQILALGSELGITPSARRARGLGRR